MKRREKSCRIEESCAISESVWLRPKRLFCEIWACAMKFSTDEKPAPTWKVPVGLSVTSTLTTMNSSEEPRFVEISTFSKKPSICTRRLLSSSRVWL